LRTSLFDLLLVASVLACISGIPANSEEPKLAPPIPGMPEPCIAFTAEQTADRPPFIKYPQPSIDSRETGEVVLAFSILPDGTVANAHVLVSSGHDRLDDAAASSVEKWQVQSTGGDTDQNSNQTAIKVDFSLANGVRTHTTLACPHPATKVISRTSHSPVIYPTEAQQQGLQGDVFVKFTIRPDGSVANAHVVQSSGSTLLDSAAIQTAQTWTYTTPLTDVDSMACITYRRPPNAPNTQPLLPGGCSTRSHPWDTPPEPVGSHVCSAVGLTVPTQALGMIVSFYVSPKGDVYNVFLETSSGDTSLDGRAVDCVKAWRYKPAILNGAAVAANWEVQIEWSMH
jgi:TonB family protein